jgi:hypothetical protein
MNSEREQKAPLKVQLSPVLTFFREAVLRDHALQERLRAADSCPAVAKIANDYLRTHLRVRVSSELEKSPLRGLVEDTFQDIFKVTVEELEQHVLYQTNARGEFLLGESELAMVAGSPRLANESSCYGCSGGCGDTCVSARCGPFLLP